MTRPSWTQPLCRTCFAAWSLGRGESPLREPVALKDSMPTELCLLCGEPTRIYIRVDPALTEGLMFARTTNPNPGGVP